MHDELSVFTVDYKTSDIELPNRWRGMYVFRDLRKQGRFRRAYRDVFTACPERRACPAALAQARKLIPYLYGAESSVAATAQVKYGHKVSPRQPQTPRLFLSYRHPPPTPHPAHAPGRNP